MRSSGWRTSDTDGCDIDSDGDYGDNGSGNGAEVCGVVIMKVKTVVMVFLLMLDKGDILLCVT